MAKLSDLILLIVYFRIVSVTMSRIDGTALEQPLQTISKAFIKLEDAEKKIFTDHFDKVYKYVTDSMGQVDGFFTKIFQRQQLAGSYADRIKVGQPNEYDALMILKFPDPVVEKSKPGFITINIKNGLNKLSSIEQAKYRALIDENGYLLQDKVFGWLRSLIYTVTDKCKNLIKVENNEYAVQKSSNGPAVTLDITVQKSSSGKTGTFSIDFVGALAFDLKDKWFADFKPPIIRTKHWNAIAKPSKVTPNKNREWTCSYANIEREYLHDTQKLKPLIRIYKKIRDTHNLTNLKSYYIKLIFLHQRLNKDKVKNYWDQKMGVLFLEMFDVILKHLEQGKLFSMWHKQYNLFNELTTVQLNDIFNKLKKIKENIVKNLAANNPEYIIFVVLSKNELQSISSIKSAPDSIQGSCKAQTDNKNCKLS